MKKILFLTVVFFVFVVCFPVNAQSGRKSPSKPSYPPVVPAPSPETPATPESARETRAKEFSFKIVADYTPGAYQVFPFPERMSQWVLDRLKTSPLIGAEVRPEGHRAEAIKLAKDSEATHIIFLNLNENVFAKPAAPPIRAQDGSMWIDFWVYAPGTGKPVAQGKTTLIRMATENGGLVRNPCYPDVRGPDYRLLIASIEVAERVMKSFDVPVRSGCRGNI